MGLVLSGGGARGAYEVGVLQYIREQIKRPCDFHVITGSSVGAINGSYLAATADRPRAQTRPLVRVWSELDLDQMYRVGWSQVRHLPQLLFGRQLPKDGRVDTVGGLVRYRPSETLPLVAAPVSVSAWRASRARLPRC